MPDADPPQEVRLLRRVLQSHQRRTLQVPGFREAAVLLPLIFPAPDAHDLPAVLLTLRRADLPTHPGQIAFPGGKRDPEDPSLEHTALREAQEEVGLDPARVDVIGLLDDVWTPAGFVITPVVAALRRPIEVVPAEAEVAEIFFATLGELPGSFQQGALREFGGQSYQLPEYHIGGRRIWGATAVILHQLLGLLATPSLP